MCNNKYVPKRLKKSHNWFTAFVSLALIGSLILNFLLINQLKEAVSVAERAVGIAREAQETREVEPEVEQFEEFQEQDVVFYPVYLECEQTESEYTSEEVDEELSTEPITSLTVEATAYCPCPSCCGTWSEQHPTRVGTDYKQLVYFGTPPKEGRTIAVDPEVIPLGTKVMFNGRTYIAEDVGGLIKGNRIDVFFDTHEEALAWGRQTLEVFLVAE